MNTTKTVIALVAVAALTLVAVGLASAQIAANQTYTGTSTDPSTGVPNPGFWGWIGSCFGLRTAQPYYGSPYVAPPAVANSSVLAPAPYQSYEPYQGGYYGNGYGYGYGSCMGW